MKINTLDKVTAAKMTALLSAAVVTASSMSGVTAYAEELTDAYNQQSWQRKCLRLQ